jgi:Uma2 family endonuclease
MSASPPSAPGLPSPASTLSAAEFAQRYAGQCVELVRGVVKELAMASPKHGKICATVSCLLTNFVWEHDCGHVMSNDSFVLTKTNPDTVRGPDVCYFSYERLPRGEVPEGLLPVAPDLVVEVRSPSDTWSAVFTKVGEYLEAGVRVVIILDAVSLSASVYRADEFQQIFHNSDDLVVPEVLPGFSVPACRLFE